MRSCLVIRWENSIIFLLNKSQCSVDIPLPITAINRLRVVSRRSPRQFSHILIRNLACYESFPFILPALSGFCLIISCRNCPVCNSSSFCFFLMKHLYTALDECRYCPFNFKSEMRKLNVYFTEVGTGGHLSVLHRFLHIFMFKKLVPVLFQALL